MAKQTIKKTRQLEITGIIDKNDEEFIVSVDGECFSLNDLLDGMCGTEIHLKCVEELV